MPEGPEVRKYADALDSVLTNQPITSIEARTRNARAWLDENASRLVGRRVERVVSHGKHLLGYIDDGFYFHSHLMMWGRWQTFSAKRKSENARSTSTAAPENSANSLAYQRGKFVLERDRRERARIVVPGDAAILLSAPIFNVGAGDPCQEIEILRSLGPDALLTIAALPRVNLRAGCYFPPTATSRSARRSSINKSWPAWAITCERRFSSLAA